MHLAETSPYVLIVTANLFGEDSADSEGHVGGHRERGSDVRQLRHVQALTNGERRRA